VLIEIARFELVSRLKRLSTWIYFAIFFALAFLLMRIAGGAMQSASVAFGAGGKVFANSPYLLNAFVNTLGLFGMLVISAVMGNAAYQDFEHRTFHLLFTTRASKRDYLLGRFAGALVTLLVIFASIGLGLYLAQGLPGVEAQRFEANHLRFYVQPYLTGLLPNLLVFGAIFFSLAALTRKMAPVYVASVVFLIGYLIAGQLFADLENRTLAGLIDPFGMSAAHQLTEYWSIAEKNGQAVPLAGPYLLNRLVWLAFAFALLAFTFVRFQFRYGEESKGGRPEDAPEKAKPSLELGAAQRQLSARAFLAAFPNASWLELKETVKNVYFGVILLAGALFAFVLLSQQDKIFGTAIYPVTYSVLAMVSGSFTLFTIILITFYSGELVWRERDVSLAQITDALPTPNWFRFSSKLVALFGMLVVIDLVVALGAMLFQLAHGYTHLEPALYVKLLSLELADNLALCVLALLVQTLVNQKYLGHFVMVLYYLSTIALTQIGFEHHLYDFGGGPQVTYSDMNGFGHFLMPALWFKTYWTLLSIALVAVIHLFWVRGTEAGWRARVREARARLTAPVGAALVVSLLGFAGVGGFIFWNTNVLNRYLTSTDEEKLQVAYEKQYNKFEAEPQPHLTRVHVDVDIFPARRQAHLRGQFTLLNRDPRPIETVYVNLPADIRIDKLALGQPFTQTLADRAQAFFALKLATPLAPGKTTTLDFDLWDAPRGFPNSNPHSELAANGTFFNSAELPTIGYQRGGEISNAAVRRKYGLPERARMLDPTDPRAQQENYLAAVGENGDWVDFDANVSTVADQIALAPGKLDREWTENGRRFFHYVAEKPMINFYSFLSARYAVKRDRWNDVAIEVYYHPAHPYNVERMIEATKAALAYCSEHYGPYGHSVIRIAEFPRYQQFAQSFIDTIPFSEGIGFIAKVRPNDDKDIDYPYFVTAHEVAHQWWAHQVIGANAKGATLMSESLAEYTALMVLKHRYGADHMRRFLKYEQDRYLMGRATEREKEQPLESNENQQYIHYSKGGAAFYALQDAIGEDKVDAALRRFLEAHRYAGPPYPIARELVDELKKAAPPEYAELVPDLFESIVLFQNRATSAVAKKLADGRYEVTLQAKAAKIVADASGNEKHVPVHDRIEFAVFDAAGKALFDEKRPVDSEDVTLTVTVSGVPASAGIDPYNVLLDRDGDDNRTHVEL
jgi:ABC-2 type transport system permease protein